jgi:hypothetical protein
MTDADWVRAGLLDPTSADADGRRALLCWLTERGVSLEQMVESNVRGRLFGLAGDLHARPTRPTLTIDAAAARIGLDARVFWEVWRRYGFADPAADETVLSEVEADTFGILAVAVPFLGEATVLRLTSTVGTATRRMAEAIIVAGIDESPDMLLDRSANELATAQVYEAAMSMIPAFLDHVDTVFRLHHEAGNRHVELGLLLGDAPGSIVRLGVGFADLSGYTPLVSTLTRAQLAELNHRFAAWAGSVVTAAGGRVVSQIGDAVMFVGAPEAVADAGVRLASESTAHNLPPLRSGMTFGDVVLDGGDYFGPVVNLAARLTSDAEPHETLVDEELAAGLDDVRWRKTPTPPRGLKGIADPVVAVRLTRR